MRMLCVSNIHIPKAFAQYLIVVIFSGILFILGNILGNLSRSAMAKWVLPHKKINLEFGLQVAYCLHELNISR